MGLQVRLRHAMGERVLEIAATEADRPFVVGRGADANLVVPSVSVAPRQCALFVHNEQWIVQEWTAGGTRLNGRPIKGPTALKIGDVLTIGGGATAATLEIDPGGAALGRGGSPAWEGDQPPIAEAVPVSVAQPQPVAPVRPQPAPKMRPRPAPAPVSPAAIVRAATRPPRPSMAPPPAAGDAIDWAAVTASAEESANRRHARPKNSSPASLVVAIVLALAIMGGTAWFVAKKMREGPQVVVIRLPADARPVQTQPTTLPAAPSPDTADQQSSDADSTPVPAAPTTNTADDSPDPADPHADDPDWPDILIAHDMPDPAIAILRYDDYRRRNPGKNAEILKQFEADAVDRMWWRRISQLCHRRDRLAGEIQAKQKAIDHETEASMKAQLETEKASLVDDRKLAEDALRNDMRFPGDVPPDFNDDKALDAARVKRDSGKFAGWAKEILNYVRRHNGTTPWGNEDL